MSLGEYLRTVRTRLTPAPLGLPSTGARRVPGLRREEVAVLTGVSADYYTRLEQGRETNPSMQIVEALARGLDLAGDERDHLFRLAGYQAPVSSGPQVVRPELARLLGRWPDQAAFVITGTLDVLAPNLLAQTLFDDFDSMDNLARMVFLDPVARSFYADWDRAAENVVATLRHNSTRVPAEVMDPFIDELTASSAPFRTLWAKQQVRGKTHEVKHFWHRQVGELRLAYQAFDVPGYASWQVICYEAEPIAVEAFALLRANAQLRSDAAATDLGAAHARSGRGARCRGSSPMPVLVTDALIHTSPGQAHCGNLYVADDQIVEPALATGEPAVIDAAGCSVAPLLVDTVFAADAPPPPDGFDLIPGNSASFAVVRGVVSASSIRSMLIVSPADLCALVVHGRIVVENGTPTRPAGAGPLTAGDARLGAWTDSTRDMTQHLTADGRYSETRHGRHDAYTGSFWLDRDRISYLDDTGFWAFGQYHDGVLHHAGFVLFRRGWS